MFGRNPPMNSKLYEASEFMRKRWLDFGVIMWFVMMLAVWLLRALKSNTDWPRLAAHVWAMVALLNLWAWLLHPGYSISWRGPISNDNLFFGFIMLGISGAVIRFRNTDDPAERGLCRECLYDLCGNTSGVCPECGTAVSMVARRRLGMTVPPGLKPRV